MACLNTYLKDKTCFRTYVCCKLCFRTRYVIRRSVKRATDKLSFNNKAGMHLNSPHIIANRHCQGKPQPVPDKMDAR